MSQDAPFNRNLRRLRRDRAARRFAEADYLFRHVADELVARLDLVKRDFRRALEIGCAGGYLTARLRERGLEVIPVDAGYGFAAGTGAIQGDEDRLPLDDGAFDLIVSVGALDSVNDLPGALILARRTLRPDGLFLAAFAGAGSLPRLKAAMLAADALTDGASPRIHPQIDVRAAGDLLMRAGFALPVVDCEPIEVRFPDMFGLISDLRTMGATNILASRSRKPLSREAVATAAENFASQAGPDGKTAERFEILHLLGWAPSPDQPQPAKRGSATASLAKAIGRDL